MRVVRFKDDNAQIKLGKDLGDGTADLLDADPLAVFPDKPMPTGRVVPIVERLCPIMPSNLFCIGMNFGKHVAEMGGQIPQRPVVFMKPTSAVQDPGKPIELPKVQHPDGEVDYEAELAVVIGKTARDVPIDEALDYVLGYTCANDVSARWWQKQGGGGQWIRGKGFDTFCPLGPVLVTHGAPGGDDDSISDPQSLRVTCSLDGNIMQEGNTDDMIFGVAELIAFLSQDTTLLPGTVILTGTPPGVGWAREPKVLLTPGMTTVVEIERIGRLENPVF